MPVLPEDDSMIVCPGRSWPAFSASSIMALAARSFTDPPGFWPSNFASTRARGLGLRLLTSTSGVFPIRSRTLEYRATEKAGSGGAAGDRRQDRDLVVVDDLGVELVEVPHIVVVHVHIDEL